MASRNPKEHILNAATKVFAAHGFRAASVRQICAAAGVNVSMVNYHFKTKAKLYAEVVRRLFASLAGDELPRLAAGVKDAATWRAAVRTFVGRFVACFSETKAPAAYAARIFRWEVTQPSSVCAELRARYGQSVHACFDGLLAMAEPDPVRRQLWNGAVWSRIAAQALVDDRWLRMCSPPGLSRADWSRRVVDHLCDIIFESLAYREPPPARIPPGASAGPRRKEGRYGDKSSGHGQLSAAEGRHERRHREVAGHDGRVDLLAHGHPLPARRHGR